MFTDIKIGDYVALIRASEYVRVKIDRVTKTQIVTNGTPFNRRTGYELGIDRWSSARIVPITPEIEAEMQRQRHLRKISLMLTQVYSTPRCRVTEDREALLVKFLELGEENE